MKLRSLSSEELTPILLASAGILGVAPLAVYRLLTGNYLVAGIDFAAVVGFAGIAWAVYQKGAVRLASFCMAMVAIGTCILTVSIRGGFQVMWLFPATVALFFLLKPKEALIAALVAIAILTPTILDLGSVEIIAVFGLSLLVTLSLSVAFSALTVKHRQELRDMTLTDPLTGTGNRRALNDELEAAIQNAETSRSPFVLIMADVDHFKRVNDVYGHSIGDDVLRRIADCIQENIRKTDACFRSGGEEFVIILDTPDISEATRLAERLRVALYEVEHAQQRKEAKLRVTASFGMAAYRLGESFDMIYKRADDALYEAKRNGRNRVHISEGERVECGEARDVVETKSAVNV